MLNQFSKSERLTGQLVIDKLFAGGNASMAVFPLRVVFMKMGDYGTYGTNKTYGREKPPVSILVSVPKRRFHHAVERNRVKRLVREAYRLNKHILWNAMEGKEGRLAVAFICITDKVPSFNLVKRSMIKALTRIAERI